MIIKCNNCNKKFEVNSSLIPENGRTIVCGSCDYTWFYEPISEMSFLENEKTKNEIIVVNSNEITKKKIKSEEKIKTIKSQKDKRKPVLNLGKVLSYFIVGVISFVILVIILDTFKSPLSNIIPDLELILYNLFESLTDIFLFIKDLTL
jgi:predicted Zn finger-like uncharacterized protein|tara:strand:+ start:382 stop:828 length:447 start_codon:yes stop_codon:yes gene_type:complete